MLAAARREIVGNESPSEQMVREAQESLAKEAVDSASQAIVTSSRKLTPTEDFAVETTREETSRDPETRQTLTRHRLGQTVRRRRTEPTTPPDPFERPRPKGLRRIRRLIPLAIFVFVIINLLSDGDFIAQIEELWSELTSSGSSGPQ